MSDTMPALLTSALTKTYGDRPALEPLDLQVPQGQHVALVGHNGSGKTTLLRMAAGLLDPTRVIQIGIRGTTNDPDMWGFSQRSGMRVLGTNHGGSAHGVPGGAAATRPPTTAARPRRRSAIRTTPPVPMPPAR